LEPLNLDELQSLAQQRLSKMAFDYIAGGAEDELTLRENREAFRRLKLRPRVLAGIEEPDLSTTVLGTPIDLPVLLAPVAMHCLAHPEGELASARAAAAAHTIMLLSTTSTYSLEDVAQAATGPKWFQLYCYRDRSISLRLIERAQQSGYAALCVTVDTPRLGRREADIRNRFQLPPGLSIKNFEHVDLEQMPEGQSDSALAAYAATMMARSLSWDDLAWMRESCDLPLVLKGIMTAEDAKLAVEHGVEAIVVSNHGGRQLDGVSASISVLPDVVEAVDGQIEVLFDSGVRRGTDVLKALALGAKAVLIGRPYIWGLALEGEAGVKRVLAMLKDELELAMALAGCATVEAIGPQTVSRARCAGRCPSRCPRCGPHSGPY